MPDSSWRVMAQVFCGKLCGQLVRNHLVSCHVVSCCVALCCVACVALCGVAACDVVWRVVLCSVVLCCPLAGDTTKVCITKVTSLEGGVKMGNGSVVRPLTNALTAHVFASRPIAQASSYHSNCPRECLANPLELQPIHHESTLVASPYLLLGPRLLAL